MLWMVCENESILLLRMGEVLRFGGGRTFSPNLWRPPSEQQGFKEGVEAMSAKKALAIGMAASQTFGRSSEFELRANLADALAEEVAFVEVVVHDLTVPDNDIEVDCAPLVFVARAYTALTAFDLV